MLGLQPSVAASAKGYSTYSNYTQDFRVFGTASVEQLAESVTPNCLEDGSPVRTLVGEPEGSDNGYCGVQRLDLRPGVVSGESTEYWTRLDCFQKRRDFGQTHWKTSGRGSEKRQLRTLDGWIHNGADVPS